MSPLKGRKIMYNSNGLSEKVHAFVKANMPYEQTLTAQEVESAAKVAGLVFISDASCHPHFANREGFAYAILSKWGPEVESIVVGKNALGMKVKKAFPVWEGEVFSKPATVRWYHLFENEQVVFKPYLSSWFSSVGSPIDGKLLSALGIGLVTVTPPEKIVAMPIPKWVWANDGEGNGFIVDAYSTTMFASEARPLISEFIRDLQALL